MTEKTYSIEPSMFVDATIRAPWVLVSRDRNRTTGVVVVSHHETYSEALSAKAGRS